MLLGDINLAMTSTYDVDEAVQRFAELVVPQLADWCIVSVVDRDGTRRDVGRAHSDPAMVPHMHRYADLRVATNDPTAHAEIGAIRAACAALGCFQLDECDLYSSCEPCPMCLGAIYWARPRAVFFSATRADAAEAGFDDAFVYDELALPPGARTLPMRRVVHPEAHSPFAAWAAKPDRVEY